MGLDVVFANGAILRGHSAFLDNLLDTTKVASEDLLKASHAPYDYHSDSDIEDDDLQDDVNAVRFTDADLELKSDVTSSSEEDRTQPKPSSWRPNLRLEDGQAAIIIPDIAYQTWKAFVYYLYTGGEIHFKALHSASAVLQAKDDRGTHPTCSPKSMYRLATKVAAYDCHGSLDSEKLKNLSLISIVRGLSKDNIIEELFSRFTSLYSEVQKAQVEALVPFLKDPAFVQKLVGRIENAVIDGKLPHCGTTIAAITSRIIELANHPAEASFAFKFNNGALTGDKHDETKEVKKEIRGTQPSGEKLFIFQAERGVQLPDLDGPPEPKIEYAWPEPEPQPPSEPAGLKLTPKLKATKGRSEHIGSQFKGGW
ncbi:hypothetical protein H0H92_008232 [Tricholoma furcatifolium]|nr:hypothetical protein H0H92_008232 [Tricholoma furcatifolium]